LQKPNIKRNLYLILYYSIAKYLPSNSTPIFGKISRKIRGDCCKHLLDKCGKAVNIGKGASFETGQGIELGDNSWLGVNCRIGKTKIGKFVMMAPDIVILSQNHLFDDIKTPMMLQGFETHRPVIIEDDVWIGTRAIILPGRRIGKGAIIGAGSVVTKDVPPYAIVGGNPAKILRFRIKPELTLLSNS
jgi:maltose O-acetyltransferase